MTGRTRNKKFHSWVRSDLLLKFDLLNHRLGFSRAGALERAIAEYIENHKEDENAADRITA